MMVRLRQHAVAEHAQLTDLHFRVARGDRRLARLGGQLEHGFRVRGQSDLVQQRARTVIERNGHAVRQLQPLQAQPSGGHIVLPQHRKARVRVEDLIGLQQIVQDARRSIPVFSGVEGAFSRYVFRVVVCGCRGGQHGKQQHKPDQQDTFPFFHTLHHTIFDRKRKPIICNLTNSSCNNKKEAIPLRKPLHDVFIDSMQQQKKAAVLLDDLAEPIRER